MKVLLPQQLTRVTLFVLWWSIILMMFVSHYSCQPTSGEQDKALQFVDSLQQQLMQIKMTLDKVDVNDISERKDFIEAELRIIQMYGDSALMNSELQKSVEEYRALFKIYKNFLMYCKPIIMETEELFVQMKTLKKSVQKGIYPKEEFKTYYKQESEDVYRLKVFVETYYNPVIETEHLFDKRQEELSKITRKIRVKNGIPLE
jgi:hypothetical protein